MVADLSNFPHRRFVPLAFLLLALLVIGFYWYEWRPSEIKRNCYIIAEEEWRTSERSRGKSRYDKYIFSKDELNDDRSINERFTDCLSEKGL